MPALISTDLIQSTEFSRLALNESLKRSVFWSTGIVQIDAELGRLAKLNTGMVFDFTYFNDLEDNDENISSDDCAVNAVCDNITTGTERAVKVMRNKCWAWANLARVLSTSGDPVQAMMSRVANYWSLRYDAYIVSMMKGIVAENVADHASDMIFDAGGPITFSAIIDAKQTAGDRSDMLTVMVGHSSAYATLLKEQTANNVYTADGRLLYSDFAGLRFIPRDNVPQNTGVFDAYLFAPGSIGWGFGEPAVPEEIDRNASGGNGEGCQQYHTRKHWVAHPYGYSYTGAITVPNSPSNANIETAANWDRVRDRKAVHIAVLRHT